MGAELNAATSREHTVVYARVPDRHVEDGALGDDGHGLRAVVRRARPGARGRARGDRDVRGHAAGARPRPLLGGGLRRPRARTAGDRHRGGDLERQPPRGRRVPPHDVHGRATSSSPRPATSPTRSSCRCSHAASGAARCRRPATPRVRRPLGEAPAPGLRFQRKDTEQYHLCLGATGISRSDRRRFAASLLDGILGGSASSRLFQEIREKRGMAYSVYSFASQYTDTGLIGVYVGHARGEPRRVRRDRGRADRARSRRAGCARASSSARRRTSRAASRSRWSRRRTG